MAEKKCRLYDDNNVFLLPYTTVDQVSGAQRKLVSGETIRTVNGQSLLGSGNITIQGGGSSSGNPKVKSGLVVAVYGDSISTQNGLNAVEIKVEPVDVGVTLSAYPTHHDLGKTIGGHTIVDTDIGTELTFVPTTNDIGKTIGGANNYNTISQVWWQYVAKELGCSITPVTYSSSSYCSHEASNKNLATAHAWHDSQIRKAGRRKPGTMERVSPDVIILYRGCNDMTHGPYAVLTEGYFDKVDWTYPTTDVVESNKYGFKEAISLTIKKLRIAYPKAQIVIATQNVFKRIRYSNFPTNNGLYSLPQFNDAIRECANFFGCQTIDFDKDGITFENCYSEGYITDSSTTPTHPNEKGHLMMGRQAVSDLINKLHIQDIDPISPTTEEDNDSGSGGDNTTTPNQLMDNTLVTGEGIIQADSSNVYYTYANVPVTSGTTYYVNKGRNFVFTNNSGTKVSVGNATTGVTPAFYITAPTGATYLSICAKYEELPASQFKVIAQESSSEGGSGGTGGTTVTGTLMENTAVALAGNTYTESNYFTYKDVPVESNTTYYAQYGRNTVFMDSNKTFISSVNIINNTPKSQFTTPSNASYLTICARYDEVQPKNFVITKLSSGSGGGVLMENTAIYDGVTSSDSTGTYYSLVNYPVTAGKTYYIAYGRNYGFNSADGTLLSTGNATNVSPQWYITAPTGASTLSICTKYSEVPNTSDFKVVEQ